jgi:EpsI family protein
MNETTVPLKPTPAPVVPAVPGGRGRMLAAIVCATTSVVLFQFYGSAVRGYVNTSSLFWWWVSQWLDPNADAGHGWLILGLSAWLLWRNVRKVRNESSPVGSGWPPLAAMTGGLMLHAIGYAAQQGRVSILGLLLLTWGIVRLWGGKKWGRAALFPIGFMVFAIPINALDSIGFWLRVWVVDASGAIARAAGLAVLQSGTQLLAPDGRYNYDVAAACSGVRSLTAMMALSCVAGYLNFSGWGRRAMVLFITLPLVYLGNVARIAVIIFAAERGGPEWGDIAHEVMGYGVFAIVLFGVLGAISLLRGHWRESQLAPDLRGEPNTDTMAKAFRGTTSPAVIAGAVVALALGEMVFLDHLSKLPGRGAAGVALAADGRNPVDLPAFIGTEWIGRRVEVSAVERAILPEDTGYSRKNYVRISNRNDQVFFSVVLSGRDRTSIHRPELCLVGQGWTVVGRSEHHFRSGGGAGLGFSASVLRVNREVQKAGRKETIPQMVVYWFVSSDAVVGRHWQMFLHDAWNRVFRARADRWAYVLLQTDAADGDAAALERLQSVINHVVPVLQPVASK